MAPCPLLNCHHVWMLAAALNQMHLSTLHMVGALYSFLRFVLYSVCMCVDLCMSVADATEIFSEMKTHFEDCLGPVLPAQSVNSITDAVPQSKCYCTPTNPPTGKKKVC